MNHVSYLTGGALAVIVLLSGCASEMHSEIQQRCATASDPVACHTQAHLQIEEHERERMRESGM
ncbi:MAG TPA: hypothetical protein VGB82_16230 [Alphaproteobacteria bacterium]